MNRKMFFLSAIVLAATLLAACGSASTPALPPEAAVAGQAASGLPVAASTATMTGSPTATLVLTDTPAKATSIPLTATPSFPPQETADYFDAPCPSVTYVEDITVPDGWEVGPDTLFTKTWRLKNTGRCNLSALSLLVFDSGTRMGAPDQQTLMDQKKEVKSGGLFDLSLDLISPAAPGDYTAVFKILAPYGSPNGTYADIRLWVKIRVIAPTPIPASMLPTRVVSRQATIPAGGDGSVTAACPAGTAVTGGGYSSANAWQIDSYLVQYIKLDVTAMHKEGNGWTARGTNYGDMAVVLTVYAICLNDPAAVTAEVQKDISVDAKGGSRVVVACPEGSALTGGGYDAGGMFVKENIPTDKGWRVAVTNGEDTEQTYSAYAVCLTGVPVRAAWVSGSRGMPWNGSGYVKAACPPDAALTGGGFANDDPNVTVNEATVHGALWITHAYNLYIDPSKAKVASYAVCLAKL
jgi:hypothetical protein